MRARNLKPGFFKNEELAELKPLARILFQGLWCMADREGRLEDRPKRIKIEVLPYDDCNVNNFLNDLQARGFIIRYSIKPNKFIQIINFTKHQNPHMKEAESTIPAPDLHGAIPVLAPKEHGSSPADSFNLTPESLNRIPSSASPSNGDALPTAIPVPFYTCKHFELDNDFITKLLQEYPALNQETITAEISKAHDWLDDNPDRHKRRANGHLKNPRTFLKNWLNRATINPKGQQKGFQGKGIMAWASRQEDL